MLSGQPAQATAQFRNASAVVAQPVLVRFTLKQGGIAVVTQESWLPALNPDALAEVTASLPTTGLAGQYVVEAEANAQRLVAELSKVILRVDPDETLNDSNRANNTSLLAFGVLPKSANFRMQRATFSDLATGQSTSRLNVTVQSAQAVGPVEFRVRELVSGAEVGRATLNLRVGEQNLSFAGLDLTDTSKVYEACVDPDDERFVSLDVAASPLQVTAVATPSIAGPQTQIGVTVAVTPQDAAARAVTLFVSIVDSASQPVANLLSAAPRVVAGISLVEQLSWSTGVTPAGDYFVSVRVEGAGRLLAAASTPLRILSASPALTASLIANRGSVEAGKDVVLSFVARNESGNSALGPIVGTLSVFSPAGVLVFREVRQLGLLQASAVRTGASVVSLARNASAGRYLATLEFADASTSLAQAGTSFEVSPSTDALSAALSAAASFQVGASLPVSVALENRGASAISGETLTVELLNAEGGLAAESLGATVVTLAAGASANVTLTLATSGVPTGQKLLVARMGGRVLDTRPITALPVTDLEPGHLTARSKDGVFHVHLGGRRKRMANKGVGAVVCFTVALVANTVAAQGGIFPAPPQEGGSTKVLSPPTLGGAGNCSSTDWRVAVSGGLPGGEYEIYDWAPGLGAFNILGSFPVP